MCKGGRGSMSNLKTIEKIEQIFENAMKGNACVHIDLEGLDDNYFDFSIMNDWNDTILPLQIRICPLQELQIVESDYKMLLTEHTLLNYLFVKLLAKQ
jgi:hypothetical protein